MKTPPLPDARPCPFCGATEIHVEQLPRPVDGQPTTAVVSCASCLAVGPTQHLQSIAQATAAWISRFGDDGISDASVTGADECIFFLNL